MMEQTEIARGLQAFLRLSEDDSIIIPITYSEGLGEMKKVCRHLLSGQFAINTDPQGLAEQLRETRRKTIEDQKVVEETADGKDPVAQAASIVQAAQAKKVAIAGLPLEDKVSAQTLIPLPAQNKTGNESEE